MKLSMQLNKKVRATNIIGAFFFVDLMISNETIGIKTITLKLRLF